MSNIFITGARGFIGQHLIPLLIESSHTCRITCHSSRQNPESWGANNIDIVPFDLDDENPDYDRILRDVDVVIHLAARVHAMEQGGQCPDIYRQTNTVGTQNLARAAVGRGVRQFIYLSTVKVYGDKSEPDSNNMFHAYNETDIPKPPDAYASSKINAELAIKEICAHSNMDFVILRPPLVYGPGVKANFLSILHVVKKGYPLPLSSINNLRSLIYVENLAHAILISIKSQEASNQTYIVSDFDISVPDLISKIAHFMGKRSPLFSCPLVLLKVVGKILFKSDMISRLTKSLIVDSSRIRNDLQWSPPYSFDEGLEKTVKWYQSKQ